MRENPLIEGCPFGSNRQQCVDLETHRSMAASFIVLIAT
jgi:hypothetical protein